MPKRAAKPKAQPETVEITLTPEELTKLEKYTQRKGAAKVLKQAIKEYIEQEEMWDQARRLGEEHV